MSPKGRKTRPRGYWVDNIGRCRAMVDVQYPLGYPDLEVRS
jgi:hypothetical protein